jgi:hypothetical protein
MSNHLAIATVSATLSQLLQSSVGVDVPGATVRLGKPAPVASQPTTPEIGLFLYQVVPNAAYRNTDLPGRDGDGRIIQRPRAAIDLHYLLSFTGDENRLEPQRLLGGAIRTLHARPVLCRQTIRDTIANPAFSFLAASDLADDVELVKMTPLALTLEELSKLWAVFFQSPYVLSAAYQGTVVLIESEDTPQPGLPVLQRNVYSIPFRFPMVDEVVAQRGRGLKILADDMLVVTGKQLRGDVTLVVVDGVERVPSSVSDVTITLPVPPDLRAGVHGLQVMQQIMIGTPPSAHRGVQSNVAALVLCPRITSTTATNANVTLEVMPEVGAGQRISLLLNERTGVTPNAYTFFVPARSSDTATVEIPISGVKAGEYFVRVQVDGAESPLEMDAGSPAFGPLVVIP